MTRKVKPKFVKYFFFTWKIRVLCKCLTIEEAMTHITLQKILSH